MSAASHLGEVCTSCRLETQCSLGPGPHRIHTNFELKINMQNTRVRLSVHMLSIILSSRFRSGLGFLLTQHSPLQRMMWTCSTTNDQASQSTIDDPICWTLFSRSFQPIQRLTSLSGTQPSHLRAQRFCWSSGRSALNRAQFSEWAGANITRQTVEDCDE